MNETQSKTTETAPVLKVITFHAGLPSERKLYTYVWGKFTAIGWDHGATCKAMMTKHAKRGLSPHLHWEN